MTRRQKSIIIKRRCKVERLSKCITWLLVVIIMTIGEVFNINGYWTGVISATIWFIAPDITAYILENVYHIQHKTDVYR